MTRVFIIIITTCRRRPIRSVMVFFAMPTDFQSCFNNLPIFLYSQLIFQANTTYRWATFWTTLSYCIRLEISNIYYQAFPRLENDMSTIQLYLYCIWGTLYCQHLWLALVTGFPIKNGLVISCMTNITRPEGREKIKLVDADRRRCRHVNRCKDIGGCRERSERKKGGASRCRIGGRSKCRGGKASRRRRGGAGRWRKACSHLL